MKDWKIWTIIGLLIFILGAAWYITTPKYIEKGKYFAGKVKKLSVDENYGLIEVCDKLTLDHNCVLVLFNNNNNGSIVKTNDSILFEAYYFVLNKNLIFANGIKSYNSNEPSANINKLLIKSKFESHGFEHNNMSKGDHKAWHIIKNQNNTEIITNLLSSNNNYNGTVSFLMNLKGTEIQTIKFINLSELESISLDTINYGKLEFMESEGNTLQLHKH